MSLGQQDIGINTPRHGTYSKAYSQVRLSTQEQADVYGGLSA